MDRNSDLLDAHRYATEMFGEWQKQEAERKEKKAMEIMAAARRVDLSTTSAALMAAAKCVGVPSEIEWLRKQGKVTDVEVAFDTGRHIVRINREKADKFFNELGIVLHSPDVKFTEDDLKWLCECFMILTDLTEQARTVNTARFGE